MVTNNMAATTGTVDFTSPSPRRCCRGALRAPTTARRCQHTRFVSPHHRPGYLPTTRAYRPCGRRNSVPADSCYALPAFATYARRAPLTLRFTPTYPRLTPLLHPGGRGDDGAAYTLPPPATPTAPAVLPAFSGLSIPFYHHHILHSDIMFRYTMRMTRTCFSTMFRAWLPSSSSSLCMHTLCVFASPPTYICVCVCLYSLYSIIAVHVACISSGFHVTCLP